MPPIRVIVAGSEDTPELNAELWIGGERMAVGFRYDGRLHLRIEPHPDGEPWLIEAAGLALALDEAARQLAEH
jgi:hypothetical protein